MSPESLALAAALIVGTSSLAVAQAQGSSGPDGQATDGAADNPSAPGSGSSDASTRAARHQHTECT
jgi:F0F1-type ATP synthase membrane subunit c/vacuolar-type H+-ATPase subunit K